MISKSLAGWLGPSSAPVSNCFNEAQLKQQNKKILVVVRNCTMSLYTKQFSYIPFFILYFTRQFNCSLCCVVLEWELLQESGKPNTKDY